MADREECVYMAKLAEQAERYDEMVRIVFNSVYFRESKRICAVWLAVC